MKIRLPTVFKSRAAPKFIACDICLIVHGNHLLHAEQRDLIAQTDESLLQLTPTELATAARRLLPNTDKKQRIALALPGGEFVATSLNLPAIATQNLKNAVSLQLPTLLPGVTEPLLLAVQAQPSGGQTVALWLSAKRADELFKAFDKVGLFLACILPRPLVILPHTVPNRSPKKLKNDLLAGNICQLYDEDDNTVTCVEWVGNTIQRWVHAPKIDCDLPEFKAQLDQTLTSLAQNAIKIHKTDANEWKTLSMPLPIVYSYGFTPVAAILHVSQIAQHKKRRRLVISAGLVATCLILALVFLYGYENRLKKRLDGLKDRTLNINKLRSEVLQIEDSIAPIKHFPRQEVMDILNKLDRLIPKDSWISNFRIEAGIVEIEGYSPSPTKLLEALTAEKGFVEVDFSRGSRTEPGRQEENFGIKFKLLGIDLPKYWLEYFPAEK